MTGVERLMEYPTSLKYPWFVNHLERVYFPRKEEWANLPTHGSNTLNYPDLYSKSLKTCSLTEQK